MTTLRGDASALVADAAAGETVIITADGKPVAQIVPLDDSSDIRRRGLSVAELPAPLPARKSLSERVQRDRADERS